MGERTCVVETLKMCNCGSVCMYVCMFMCTYTQYTWYACACLLPITLCARILLSANSLDYYYLDPFVWDSSKFWERHFSFVCFQIVLGSCCHYEKYTTHCTFLIEVMLYGYGVCLYLSVCVSVCVCMSMCMFETQTNSLCMESVCFLDFSLVLFLYEQ